MAVMKRSTATKRENQADQSEALLSGRPLLLAEPGPLSSVYK